MTRGTAIAALTGAWALALGCATPSTAEQSAPSPPEPDPPGHIEVASRGEAPRVELQHGLSPNTRLAWFGTTTVSMKAEPEPPVVLPEGALPLSVFAAQAPGGKLHLSLNLRDLRADLAAGDDAMAAAVIKSPEAWPQFSPLNAVLRVDSRGLLEVESFDLGLQSVQEPPVPMIQAFYEQLLYALLLPLPKALVGEGARWKGDGIGEHPPRVEIMRMAGSRGTVGLAWSGQQHWSLDGAPKPGGVREWSENQLRVEGNATFDAQLGAQARLDLETRLDVEGRVEVSGTETPLRAELEQRFHLDLDPAFFAETPPSGD